MKKKSCPKFAWEFLFKTIKCVLLRFFLTILCALNLDLFKLYVIFYRSVQALLKDNATLMVIKVQDHILISLFLHSRNIIYSLKYNVTIWTTIASMHYKSQFSISTINSIHCCFCDLKV